MKMAVFRREMTALGQLFPHPAEDSAADTSKETTEETHGHSADAAKQGA